MRLQSKETDWHNSFACFLLKNIEIMADEKVQNSGGREVENMSENRHGRLYNSQDAVFEQSGASNDISSVDRQEGNMNNGECGGNLTPKSKEQ
jgi:hypothetical protein